jgi:N-acetylated-alpha-linked acidic dipeptidase
MPSIMRKRLTALALYGCIVLIGGCLLPSMPRAAAGNSADNSAGNGAGSGTMLGFGAAHAADERALEKRFDEQLDAGQLRELIRSMASEPNQVGSPHDKANAEFMLQQFQSWGWSAQLESFSVLYPTPKKLSLEMVAPRRLRARLHEPKVAADMTSAAAGALPPYNIYGADGDVTAELVYVNYGSREDYQELDQRGISVKGRIVIARYGNGWRGLKPKLAYQHGAVGCLIYSDPHEDGYGAGDVYPQGGFRPEDGVQRGSVADLTLYSGDPLTPGVGATAEARRLPLSEVKSLMKIPVMPISYGDARPLLAALSGAVAPPAWRGSLGQTYHIGPGAAMVHMHVESDWGMKMVYDVVARIQGSELPDEWVVRGNHHDGWVFGAWDPLSGNAALLSEARAIGALLQSGWRPRRTLIYCSWDGEEPGLIGSTEWAETHARELQAHAVLYVNSDTNGRGFLNMGGSHSLQRLVNEVAAGVHDAQTDGSVLARLRAKLRVDAYNGGNDQARKLAAAAASGADIPLGALGSGSDYTPFLQHLGLASVDLGFGGEGDDAGIYHSLYDTFEHYQRFGDPSFAYGVALAESAGHLMLRMADSDVLPLQFTGMAEVMEGYVHELHQLADERRDHAQKLAELRQGRAFELAADPTRPVGPPEAESEVPYLDFAPLDNAIAHLKRAARAYDEALSAAAAHGFTLGAGRQAQLDATLQGLEQTLTSDQGLPGRPWYRHLIYAPGVYTGYGAKTMPGVREAIEDHRWEESTQYVALTARALEGYAERVEAASALLRN